MLFSKPMKIRARLFLVDKAILKMFCTFVDVLFLRLFFKVI